MIVYEAVKDMAHIFSSFADYCNYFCLYYSPYPHKIHFSVRILPGTGIRKSRLCCGNAHDSVYKHRRANRSIRLCLNHTIECILISNNKSWPIQIGSWQHSRLITSTRWQPNASVRANDVKVIYQNKWLSHPQAWSLSRTDRCSLRVCSRIVDYNDWRSAHTRPNLKPTKNIQILISKWNQESGFLGKSCSEDHAFEVSTLSYTHISLNSSNTHMCVLLS